MRQIAWSALGVAAALSVNALAPAAAQTCEKRSLVVGYSPGGTGDIVANAIAEPLSRKLGQPVVVEHRPGASGGVAAQGVANATPDGCTLLVGQTAEIAVNPAIVRNLGYDPARDLKPVALLATTPLALVVARTAPYGSVAELVAAARAATPALTFASAGRATPGYFAGELFRLRTRAGLAHITFDGGGDALQAVVTGKAALYFPALPTALADGSRGQVKILAVSSAQRSLAIPDVQTVEETGLSPFNLDLWVGLFAPRGTPDGLTTSLNQAVGEVLLQPKVKSALLSKGANATPMRAEQFASFVSAETTRYATLIDREFCSTCPW